MTTPDKPPMRHRLGTDDAEMTVIDDPETPSGGQRPKRRGRRLALGSAVVAAGGLGVLGWMLMSARDDARARADALAEENQSLQDALDLHRTSKLELDSKLAQCEETRELAEADSSATVSQLEMSLAVCQDERADMEGQNKEVARRLADLDALTGRFQKMVDTGDLSVKMRRGQMVVELPSAVLFPSGSAELSDKGKKTFLRVAAILAQMPDRKFTVAGHTDNVPIKSEEFASNWELSAARAVTVTEELIAAGVSPRSLVAAGYGEYAPIARNRSARGRRLNRRIEIILEPDLTKLPIKELARRAKKAER